MGAWMWVRMVVERQHVAVDPLKQTPFLSPRHTCSDCLYLVPFQFHRRLSSLHSQPVLLIKSILIQCLYFDISEAYRQLILLQGGSLCVCVSQLLSSVFKRFHKSLFCNKTKQLR